MIFTRYPESGKAKTRLIPALGSSGAAGLHRQMTEHAVWEARNTRKLNGVDNCEVTICCTGANISDFREWLGNDLHYMAQTSGDLGFRMKSAFLETFKNGSKSAIVIGSDVPDLTTDILHLAQKNLCKFDVVLGPAVDGGYYLIGMRVLHPDLFTDIDWGTDRVFNQTLEKIKQLELRVTKLPLLCDIDRPDDLIAIKDDPRFAKS